MSLNEQWLVGRTPIHIETLNPGQYEVLVRSVGYADSNVTIKVKSGQAVTIDFTLRAVYGLVWAFGSGGSATGQFNRPFDVAIDGLRRVFVTDHINDRVQVFDDQCEFITTFGSNGTETGQFRRPAGVECIGDDVYVVDSISDRVQVFDTLGKYLRQFRFPMEDMSPNPIDVSVLPDGRVLVTDFVGQRVALFLQNGMFAGHWLEAGEDVRRYFGISHNTSAVFVGDRELDGILQLHSDGTPAGEWAYSTAGSVRDPGCISVGASGLLAVTETTLDRVLIVDLETTQGMRVSGEGSAFGPLQSPVGLDWRSDGLLVVADNGNDRVVVIRPPLPAVVKID